MSNYYLLCLDQLEKNRSHNDERLFMELDEYGEPLAYELAFWMQGLTDPEYPLGELGSLSFGNFSQVQGHGDHGSSG